MTAIDQTRRTLLQLSHELGAEHRCLAILGEGNTSARLDEGTFLVKASGSSLGALQETDVVACKSADLLALMDAASASEEQIEATLFASRIDPAAKKPSIEALFHAYLLSLPGVAYVGHTHPTTVNGILCSPLAEKFALRRIFPDEIVCCGTRSVFIPYCDPGLKLSQAIREGTEQYLKELGAAPRVILLQNHGVITVGRSPEAVKAAMYMTVKAAAIFTAAAALGGPVFLSQDHIESIAGRLDEHHRQRALNL